MITVTMWHDPDCPKSAKALAALKEFPVEVLLRPILQQPPTVEELRGALAMLQATPQALLRKREPMAKELGLDHAPDDELLEALVTYPSLIERPLVFRDARAVLGKPPIRVLEILRPATIGAHIPEALQRFMSNQPAP